MDEAYKQKLSVTVHSTLLYDFDEIMIVPMRSKDLPLAAGDIIKSRFFGRRMCRLAEQVKTEEGEENPEWWNFYVLKGLIQQKFFYNCSINKSAYLIWNCKFYNYEFSPTIESR